MRIHGILSLGLLTLPSSSAQDFSTWKDPQGRPLSPATEVKLKAWATAAQEVGQMLGTIRTRAVVKIERPEGVSYWQIQGSGDLLRLAGRDSGFGTLLLSADFVGDELQVDRRRAPAAGNPSPGEASLCPAARGSGRPRGAPPAGTLQLGRWKLRLASPAEPKAADDCCKCSSLSLLCCPASGSRLTCATCEDCRGD